MLKFNFELRQFTEFYYLSMLQIILHQSAIKTIFLPHGTNLAAIPECGGTGNE